MIFLISGATHSGKTFMAQKLLEKYHYPYLSIDHLKMGLIRSGQTTLTVYDDEALVPYLWSIVREMIKTAIENNQNMIVEGCYIPFDWKKDFTDEYLPHIVYRCLIMTERYIRDNFNKIRNYANVVEQRLDDSDLNIEQLVEEHSFNLAMCNKHGCEYILIDENYEAEIEKGMV